MSRSESELIEACLNGDGGAWDELYRSHYARVRRIIGFRRWGFSNNEVEDGIQEVFLEVVRSLPRFRGEANLTTFIARLARNRCISHLRKKTALKRGKEELGYVLEEGKGDEDSPRAIAVEGGAGPEDLLVGTQDAQALVTALEQLGADCQQIIRLRYFHQQSYNEICGLLELPLGTVCSRLKRCLMKLKSLLDKQQVTA
ncbi:sigma-70 family RNA polymerase sigma factor [bacterium]|nr:sigma-70 family RNA polymerase sigma factor [bacterium]